MLKTPRQKISLKEKNINISGLKDSAAAYILSQNLKELPKISLVLCKDLSAAVAFLSDLRLFLAFNKESPTSSMLFPAWDISPYSKLSPSAGNRVQRLSCLQKIRSIQTKKEKLIIVSHGAALAQGTIAPDQLEALTWNLELHKEYEMDKICSHLEELNYSKTDMLEDPGTYSLRGGVLDIFCPTQKKPYRLDFFGNEIENISFFHPATQKRIKDVFLKRISISPLRELESSYIAIERARAAIWRWANARSYSRQSREYINKLLLNKIISPEMDFFLPFFNSKRAFLWDYLDLALSACVWIEEKEIKSELSSFISKKEEEFKPAVRKETIIPSPEELYISFDMLKQKLEPAKSIFISYLHMKNTKIKNFNFNQDKVPPVLISKESKKPNLTPLLDLLSSLLSINTKIFFIAGTQTQLDRLYFLLAQNNIKSIILDSSSDIFTNNKELEGKLILIKAVLQKSFSLPEEAVFFLSEQEVFGIKRSGLSTKISSHKSFKKALAQTNLDDLNKNDYIVHIEHGLGVYKGLKHLKINHIVGDYVHIEYADKDRLYLPVYRLEFIQKYTGTPGKSPPIDKLGSKLFDKTKSKAKRIIKDLAISLLKIYAKRQAQEGFACAEPDETYREFELSFPYEETLDQAKAIEDTINDMCSKQPMDRLICGDVGYGKTEVAIRAAFHAVNNGKQVAILVPTTILAEQHLQRFQERLNKFPILIKSLSRFHKTKQQKKIVQELKEKKIDIIIGTHRLLSSDIDIPELALLVIDEEQRFGVIHKEKLKKIRQHTNVLTLTATPIPRTLYLSLAGIRDMSIIQTAPSDRLAIRTFIVDFDEDIIRAAIKQEINRGGQVFFIHNRVESIPSIYRFLTELCPDIKVAVAHGQLPAKELENVMISFYKKDYDLLLSTSIIENGLDIPSTNTILVNQAQNFGLSQLYQIRGRVGRSHTKAFAYFILPKNKSIRKEAKERLHVLQRHVELGSGFAVASHDLELRGGGDILGDAQSGHLTAIGYELYMELLEEEIASLKGKEIAPVKEIEIRSPFPAYIPEEYIQSPRFRLSIYKRFSNYVTKEEVEEGREELIDRYGKVPQVTESFFYLLKIKILLRDMGFQSLILTEKKCSLEAKENNQLDVERLLQLVRENPKTFQIGKGGMKLIFQHQAKNMEEGYNALRRLFQKLSSVSLPKIPLST